LRLGKKMDAEKLWIGAGLLFALLWSSASTATKAGLTVAQPFVIADVRFMLAAAIMLFVAYVIRKERLPSSKEWKQLAVYGLLNITVYLGCYVVAMKTITAGIGALAVTSNPVFMSFLSVFFLRQSLTPAIFFPSSFAFSVCFALPGRFWARRLLMQKAWPCCLPPCSRIPPEPFIFLPGNGTGFRCLPSMAGKPCWAEFFCCLLPFGSTNLPLISSTVNFGFLLAGWPCRFPSEPCNCGCGYCKKTPLGRGYGYFSVPCLVLCWPPG